MKDAFAKSNAGVVRVFCPAENKTENSGRLNVAVTRGSRVVPSRPGSLKGIAAGLHNRPCLGDRLPRNQELVSHLTCSEVEFRLFHPDTGVDLRRRLYLCIAWAADRGILAHGYGTTAEHASEIARSKLAEMRRTEAASARRAAMKVIESELATVRRAESRSAKRVALKVITGKAWDGSDR